ncbi:MAG: DUF1592 domain-containing protein [Nannocystaceae bacterium]
MSAGPRQGVWSRALPIPWTLAVVLAGGCYSGGPASDASEASAGQTGSTGDVDDSGAGTSGTGGTGEPDAGPSLPWSPMHRLNRLEYNNTVRDLLGTSLRPADGFGPDPEANGFDNMAAQLKVSPSLVDAYDQAARAVLADALDPQPAFRVAFAGDALAVDGGYPIGDLWALSGKTLAVTVEVSAHVEAELVLTAGGTVGGAAPAPQARFTVNGVALPPFAIQGSAAIPSEHVQAISLTAGTHTIAVTPTNHVNQAAENTFNNVFVLGLAVRSVDMVPGPGHARVFVCEPAGGEDAGCYAEILRTFAARAWRRPLTPAEATSLADLFAELQAEGEGADAAMRLVMRATMLSPKFFYRARTTADGDGDGWLDDYVLASRLSYFLWSSMPDQRLFDMAAEGRLASDEGLSEAVAFMLEDPRASALLDGFAEQWLALRHLDSYSPDPEAFPGFEAPVRAAMREESRLFFADFLANGEPVGALVLPDFTYRNDALAAHYGEAPVESEMLIRVPASGPERRGLLALGGWLTATSHADHSSPIRRGRWLSERLLCAPVPPPPPGLEFEPPDLGQADSVREALEKHRDDPTCASCHVLLDVLGIGLEEYDGVAAPVGDPEVDNLGELPDGRTFNGAAALAELYVEDGVFVECFTRTLFTYALGHPPSGADGPALRSVAAAATAGRESLPELIDALVHTPSFRSPAPLDPGE